MPDQSGDPEPEAFGVRRNAMTTARLRGLVPALAVLPLVVLATACGSGSDQGSTAVEPDPLTLNVESQGWTGWQEQQPEPELTTETITDGATFRVTAISGPIGFTVTDIADDHIELETDDSLIVTHPGDGLDFDEATTRFTLELDEPLTLGTPTMDAGTSITLAVG